MFKIDETRIFEHFVFEGVGPRKAWGRRMVAEEGGDPLTIKKYALKIKKIMHAHAF